MNKETIEKLLKIKIDLFKIYSFFLVGLITGVIGFLLKYIRDNESVILTLLIIGSVVLIVVAYVFSKTYLKIIKLIKELKK